MATPTAVDIHAHYFPERFFAIIEESGQPFGARIDRSHATGPIVEVQGTRTTALEVTYWDLDRNPFDTAVAAAHLVFGGVLDRHPRLEVCLPHAGGALPYLMGRLTHGQAVRPETKGVARRPFERYLRRFTYDTITHSPSLLKFLIDTVGADRVMLGSDYCFDMGYTRPVEVVTQRLRLNRTDQRRILGSTATRLLRLG